MKLLKLAGATFLIICFVGFLWGLLVPKSPEEIGFAIDDPTYLLGCYSANGVQIQLYERHAEFDGEDVPISFGMRKTLREVVYPSRFPWLNPETGTFQFKNDRFDLLDLVRGPEGGWAIEIWNAAYLETGDPDDLRKTVFREGTCE